jgi:glutamyl-tRNA synthetase
MHIGNLRTALYEYLIAKSQNGSFILRVEDTDQNRLVEGAIDLIYESLRVAGLRHDEGPDIGGAYGPYIQSERKEGYMERAKELIDGGAAYYCFCTKERLAALKGENESSGRTNRYDRHCLDLTEEDVRVNLKKGAEFVVRQKMPVSGKTKFHDAVYGDIEFDNNELEDQILIKSDGLPTYNFANVVDDHMMEITHVVRGSEYITSTPKYSLLYKSFGWKEPVYVHLPQIVKEGGRKLSKREGDPSFVDLLEMGFLSEAIINYIAMLGWSPSGNREFFTLGELVETFSIDGIGKAPSYFDIDKLKFYNAEYLRRKTQEEFHELALPFIRKVIKNPLLDTGKIALTLSRRTEVLGEIPGMISFLEEAREFSVELYTHKKMKSDPDTAKMALSLSLPQLKALANWDGGSLQTLLAGLAADNGLKAGQILWPLRVALSGMQVTPGGAVEILDILGREESIKRLESAFDRL